MKKKNGKGKEYYYGEKNGKGKEYDYKGRLIFEGEYLYGEKNGKGKEFYRNCEIKFEGEYLYNYRRKGKAYINGRLEYEGDYLYLRKWNGKGYDENGNIIYELINGNGKVKEYGNDEEEDISTHDPDKKILTKFIKEQKKEIDEFINVKKQTNTTTKQPATGAK